MRGARHRAEVPFAAWLLAAAANVPGCGSGAGHSDAGSGGAGGHVASGGAGGGAAAGGGGTIGRGGAGGQGALGGSGGFAGAGLRDGGATDGGATGGSGTRDGGAADRAPASDGGGRDVPPEPDGGLAIGTPSFCTSDGWCWENPLPQGIDLYDVFSLAPNDVWAVGEAGVMLHFDGRGWRDVDPGVPSGGWLQRIYGFAWNDVYAGGGNGVIHFDGASWSPVAAAGAAPVTALGGSGPDNIWASFEGFTGVEHYGGPAAGWGSYALDTSIGPRDVFSFSGDDAWVAGESSLLEHFDGKTWTAVAGAPPNNWAVWGAAPGDVWVASDRGYFYHWDGQHLTGVGTGDTWNFQRLWGSGRDDVWAPAARGTAGTPTVSRLFHLDGLGAWSAVDPGGGGYFVAVGGTSPTDVWTVGQRGLMQHWDGVHWSARGSVDNDTLMGAWAASATAAFAVDSAGRALRYDGTAWTATQTADTILWGVGGTAANDVWTVGTKVSHFDGQTWSTVLATTGYEQSAAVWASAANDVWVTGDDGAAYHWDGTSFSSSSGPTGVGVMALWGAAANDVWALTGLTWHYDGGKWTRVDSSAAGASLYAVWGTASTNVWAVGATGHVARWQGLGWAAAPGPPTTDDLLAIWGAGPTAIYVASRTGAIFMWNGSSWQTEQSGANNLSTSNQINALAGAGNQVWAFGAAGMILGHTR